MKQRFTLIKVAVVFWLTIFSLSAFAQSSTSSASPFAGPSDATTAPPATATDAGLGQVLCAGSTITLKGDADPSVSKYQWYKVNSSGTKTLVYEGTTNSYTETAAGAGYYIYYLVKVNSNTCTSDVSDPFKLYVLPALNPTVDGGNSVCEKNQSTTDLKVAGLDSRFSYTYQWTRNGSNITTDGTSATYTVKEATAGTVKYAVNVAYTLKSSCTATSPDKSVTVVPVPTKPTITFGN
ncbi:hypothetical protein HH214_12460 [Mucilaginibacter robiniae]|uniref:Ig-like domain-containing protein n=1 Tax=Mucilaginibacter robiniae TaxID=2728022 RepID=A0A7L5E076_9SPHI|nr:hypothetical protein [Mucilaginibacter robiniae]QJD96635.1 hypothetical protein HH214_12460 [Mucilaginibacter robiniae]